MPHPTKCAIFQQQKTKQHYSGRLKNFTKTKTAIINIKLSIRSHPNLKMATNPTFGTFLLAYNRRMLWFFSFKDLFRQCFLKTTCTPGILYIWYSVDFVVLFLKRFRTYFSFQLYVYEIVYFCLFVYFLRVHSFIHWLFIHSLTHPFVYGFLYFWTSHFPAFFNLTYFLNLM